MTSQIDDMTESMKKVLQDENSILKDLDQYIEEPFKILESYFTGQSLEHLVRHQLNHIMIMLTFKCLEQ